jgi:hypothetical protein
MRKIPPLFGLTILSLTALAEARPWTDSTGRQVEAEYSGMQGDSVLLKLASGQTVPFPLARLSAEDQAFAKAQASSPAAIPAAATATKPDAARIPLEKRTWPQNVIVPAKAVEIAAISENAADRKYVYQSEAFEFSSQAKLACSGMIEVARTF